MPYVKHPTLATARPDLVAEMTPGKNPDIDPTKVTLGSAKTISFTCSECGHEWSATLVYRALQGTGCPRCFQVRMTRPKPGRSLAERFPGVAAQLHPTLNGDLDPATVASASVRSLWWLCPDCGQAWKATARARTVRWPASQVCPGCDPRNRRRVSLLDAFPGVAAQLHPTLNGDLDPATVAPRATRKLWWLCPECGHEWQAYVSNRTNGTKCPECVAAQRNRYRPGGAHADFKQVMATEFDPDLNPGIDPSTVKRSSEQPITFRCASCDHVWTVQARGRARGRGCPACAKRQRDSSGRLQVELKPERETYDAFTALADAAPGLAATWHPTRNGDLTPEDVPRTSNRLVWWLCPTCGSGFRATLRSRWYAYARYDRVDCKHCPRLPRKGQSLEEKFPRLAAQFDLQKNAPLTPQRLRAWADIDLWWTDVETGREWQEPLKQRALKEYRAKSLKPASSLDERFPGLAAQLHPTKNGDVDPRQLRPYSGVELWWIDAETGREWKQSLVQRTQTERDRQRRQARKTKL